MGCFNYCCSMQSSPNCHDKKAESGQDPKMMNVKCYAVNGGRKWEVFYDGHGACSTCPADPETARQLYDLGHEEFFDGWDVKETDMRANLACAACAKSIDAEVESYEELVCAAPSAKMLAKHRAYAKFKNAVRQTNELKRKRGRYEDLMASLDAKLAKKQAHLHALGQKCGKGNT